MKFDVPREFVNNRFPDLIASHYRHHTVMELYRHPLNVAYIEKESGITDMTDVIQNARLPDFLNQGYALHALSKANSHIISLLLKTKVEKKKGCYGICEDSFAGGFYHPVDYITKNPLNKKVAREIQNTNIITHRKHEYTKRSYIGNRNNYKQTLPTEDILQKFVITRVAPTMYQVGRNRKDRAAYERPGGQIALQRGYMMGRHHAPIDEGLNQGGEGDFVVNYPGKVVDMEPLMRKQMLVPGTPLEQIVSPDDIRFRDLSDSRFN